LARASPPPPPWWPAIRGRPASIAARRDLTGIDLKVDAMIVAALEAMDKPLRRRFLHAYLGFPFYDVATLPLLQGEGMGEFDPIKVDRISPDDATSIRAGGTLDACAAWSSSISAPSSAAPIARTTISGAACGRTDDRPDRLHGGASA
jgi:hypothetical protein